MPTFKVTDPSTGRTLRLTSEDNTPPTEQELEQVFASQIGGRQQTLPTKATKDQFLSAGERISGRFRTETDLANVRARQRQERGLASGTPLEPVGFNFENLLDLPTDLAEGIVGAFPTVFAAGGGLLAGAAALPTGPGALAAIAGGGAAGGAFGQLVKQEIGKRAFGFDQGEVIEQLGNIAREGAFGSLQEVGGVALGRAINATKLGLINTANKLITKRGGEGFVRGFASLATHLDDAKVNFALDAVKRGDRRILDKVFADKNFTNKFTQKLFFGIKFKGDKIIREGNFAQQFFNLAHKPGAKESIKSLYKTFTGLADNELEQLFVKGNAINKFRNPKVIMALGERISQGLNTTFVKAGRELSVARKVLASKGANIDVKGLTQFNAILAKRLKEVGLLIDEGQGLFSINPKFKVTGTGKSQAGIFGELVDRFFTKTGPGDVNLGAKQAGTFQINDAKVLQQLVNNAKGKRKVLYSINNTPKFREFIDKLGSLDAQISGAEFKQLGKLSPELTVYLQGLRSIPEAVEKQLGGSRVATLNKAFRELAEGASLLRQGTKKVLDPIEIEAALQKFTKTEPATLAGKEVSELNIFLQKHLGINFLDDLRSFAVAQKLKAIDGPLNVEIQKRVIDIMKNAVADRNVNPLIGRLKTRIDKFLPKDLRIGEVAEIHTVADALHRNAASLLRGRFLYNSGIAPVLNAAIVPTLGAAAGGLLRGPQGAAIGLGLGLALQQPGALRFLIKASAKLSNAEVKKLIPQAASSVTKQVFRTLPAQARVLRELLKTR